MPTAAIEVAQQPDRLPAEVLIALVAAAQPGLRRWDTGCLTHTTGTVRWLGVSAKVKPILWEAHHGQPVPSGSNLVRLCRSGVDCIEPTHLASIPRHELGSWLGRPGGAWRPQVA